MRRDVMYRENAALVVQKRLNRDRAAVSNGDWGGVGRKDRVLGGRAHCRHLTNSVERLSAAKMSGDATRGGYAASSQITLGNFVLVGCVHGTDDGQPQVQSIVWILQNIERELTSKR